MIGRLTGVLREKTPPQILLDVGGVGYEVDVPMSTFYALPETGAALTLHTQLVVREDAHLLYGFATPEEREAFRRLLRVSGIGARLALAVLSGLSVHELAMAVAAQDVKVLSRIPGIGKKTAERLALELRDKLSPGIAGAALTGATPTPHRPADDVLNALLALGYNEREATWATGQVDAGNDVAEGIRQALKLLSK